MKRTPSFVRTKRQRGGPSREVFTHAEPKLPPSTPSSVEEQPVVGTSSKDVKPSGNQHQYSAVDLSTLLHHLVEVADSLWKANLRWQKAEPTDHTGPLKHLGRNLDSGLAALHAAGFEVKDHTEERYAEGSRVEVLAFQPVDGMLHPTIIETLKPTIYFMERLIRPGQVIVGKPVDPK